MIGKLALVRFSALTLGLCAFASSGCKSDEKTTQPQTGSNLPVIACNSDGQCSPPVPYCDTVQGLCVQCLGDANCTGGATCNLTTHLCVQCTSNAECSPPVSYCSPRGRCVQCLTAANCGDTNQTCDPNTYRCVASCASDTDCPGGQGPLFGGAYCHPTRHVCVECLASANCEPDAPYCETQDSVCVECLTDANCGDAGATCSGNYQCRQAARGEAGAQGR